MHNVNCIFINILLLADRVKGNIVSLSFAHDDLLVVGGDYRGETQEYSHDGDGEVRN